MILLLLKMFRSLLSFIFNFKRIILSTVLKKDWGQREDKVQGGEEGGQFSNRRNLAIV